jgi:uncharacterized protein YkwD
MRPLPWAGVILVIVLAAGCSSRPVDVTLPPGTPSPTAFLPDEPSPRPRPTSLGPDRVATLSAGLAGAQSAYPPKEMSAVGDALLLAVNQRRVEAGIAPLKSTPVLTKIAQLRVEDMLVRDYFGHTDPESGDPLAEPLLKSAGFTGRVAENVYATDAPEHDLVAQVVEAWFASPSHRANLLDPELRYTGLGLAGDGAWWTICQVFAQQAPS